MVTATKQEQAVEKPVGALTLPQRGPTAEEDSKLPVLAPGTALVRYQSIEDLMKPRVSRWMRLQMAGLWAVLMVGLYVLFQTSGYQKALKDVAASQDRSLATLGTAVTNEESRIGGVAGDVNAISQQVATLTGNAALRLNTIDQKLAAEERLNHQLMERLARLEAARVAAPVSPISQGAKQKPGRTQPVVQSNVSTSPLNLHSHNVNMSIPVVRGATIHTNAMAQQDYWIVPHEVRAGVRLMVRVMPYEVTAAGVKVHSIDDGNDYTLTTAGDWMNN